MTLKLYEPDNIPSEITITLCVWYRISGYNAGRIGVYDFDFEGDENTIVLCKIPVTLNIPAQENVREEVLKTLRTEKLKQVSIHHIKLKQIQEKIDNLLAIEYQPAEDANV